MPNWLTTALGIGIIAGTLPEVFFDLFHPSRRGTLSDGVGRGLFALLRRRPRMLPMAGPLTLALVIAIWVVLFACGFALIYYGGFPRNFQTSTGTRPPGSPHLLSCLYFSLEVITTLGMGDITPTAIGLRLVATAEAFIGFGLLTASVSWIVLLYPALARMRLLARGISILVNAEEKITLRLADSESEVFLAELARDVVRTRVDLVHFPLIYYFAPADSRASVAHQIGHAERFAREGLEAEQPVAIRMAAAALDSALDDLAEILARQFLGCERDSRSSIFGRYAEAHVAAE